MICSRAAQRQAARCAAAHSTQPADALMPKMPLRWSWSDRRLCATSARRAAAVDAAATASTAAGGYYPTQGPSPEQLAGFYPRPQGPAAEGERKGWGLSKFLVYVGIHLIPIGGGIYLFHSATTQKEAAEVAETEVALTADSCLREAMQIVKTAATCLCLCPSDDDIQAFEIDPHEPEYRSLSLPEQPVIKGVQNNELMDLFAGERGLVSLPFNFIHFGVSASSDVFRKLVVHGTAAVIDSKEQRRHYWKRRWGASLTDDDYRLVKVIPDRISLQGKGEGDVQWRLITLRRGREGAGGGVTGATDTGAVLREEWQLEE
mmetsp:Transcript_13197/g.38080  ORF Transcript_13197/g.38080 Transcript_13197/m.38080 type:complete len:318 (+) Transcript_13197:127-1080(+)